MSPDRRRACYLLQVAKRVGVLLMFLTLAAPVRAELPPQVSIHWSGACPRPFGLEAEVARLLGGARRGLPAAELEVEVESARTGYTLTLEVDRGTSQAERTVELASCRDAQDAAVLLIATALEPDAVARVPKPPPPPLPPPPLAAPRPRGPSYRWSLVMRGLFDLQALPAPTLGPSLGGLWQGARWRTWLDVRYLPARTARARSADVEARVDAFTAGLGAGNLWTWGAVRLGPALELELGALRARGGRSPLQPRNDAGPWGSAQLGAVMAYAATRRFGLELGAFAGVPLWRPELSAGGVGSFYRTAAVTMRLALGVRISLGSR